MLVYDEVSGDTWWFRNKDLKVESNTQNIGYDKLSQTRHITPAAT